MAVGDACQARSRRNSLRQLLQRQTRPCFGYSQTVQLPACIPMSGRKTGSQHTRRLSLANQEALCVSLLMTHTTRAPCKPDTLLHTDVVCVPLQCLRSVPAT